MHTHTQTHIYTQAHTHSNFVGEIFCDFFMLTCIHSYPGLHTACEHWALHPWTR